MFNKRTMIAAAMSLGLGAIAPLMSERQKAKIKPAVTMSKSMAKRLGLSKRGIRQYVKYHNGGTKSGAASLKRAASKRKMARAKASKR